MNSEEKRRENNTERVLNLLQQRGKTGATNAELIVCGGYRYGARIFELRRAGWEIETLSADGGLFRFILKGRARTESKAEQQNLFQEARP